MSLLAEEASAFSLQFNAVLSLTLSSVLLRCGFFQFRPEQQPSVVPKFLPRLWLWQGAVGKGHWKVCSAVVKAYAANAHRYSYRIWWFRGAGSSAALG